MATNLRKPSRLTVTRVRELNERLGRSATAKIIGVRPSRLDKYLEGKGRTNARISSRVGAAHRDREELSLAASRAYVLNAFRERGEKKVPTWQTNKALAELLTALQLNKKKSELSDRQRKKIVNVFIKMGIPPSGPGAVYFKRAGSRRR